MPRALRFLAVTSALALYAACSSCPAAPTLEEIEPVALLQVVSASGLPTGVPTVALSFPALDGSSKLDTSARRAGESLTLGFDDAMMTSATCDASAIASFIATTGADVRDSANLIPPTQSFMLICTGAGAWDGVPVGITAKGVTAPLHDAPSFTLELDLVVMGKGVAASLVGTQAFGVVDVAAPARSGC